MPVPVGFLLPALCLALSAECTGGPAVEWMPAPAWSDTPRNHPAPGQGDLDATLRSLVAPGWGQHRQDRGHWWIYPVVEAVGFGGWIEGRASGHRYRDRYRDLAWNAARAPVWSGPRMDGSWEYYERMGTWVASGRFDRDPASPELSPETDPATYNGSIWQLARQLHSVPGDDDAGPADPNYQRALDYYRSRAVPEELQWDWSFNPGDQVRFRNLVETSDDGFRRATGFVGLILLNHFISATEAWMASHSGPLGQLPLQASAHAEPSRYGPVFYFTFTSSSFRNSP